jgi:hypothetical protein
MPQLTGTNPDQLPSNQQLGRMAYQDPAALVLEPQASVTPHRPGSMVFQLTSDTALTVRVRGLDGVVRSATLTLA